MPRLKQLWSRDHAAYGYSRRGNFGGSGFHGVVPERYIPQQIEAFGANTAKVKKPLVQIRHNCTYDSSWNVLLTF